jgi:hypothetical protein
MVLKVSEVQGMAIMGVDMATAESGRYRGMPN